MSVAKLSHPNILVDLRVRPGRRHARSSSPSSWTVRRCAPGWTRGALPPRRAVAYALQIAKGIAAAHARGIVHRDLKPENVMITPRRPGQDSRLRSRQVDRHRRTGHDARAGGVATNAGMVLGTFGYMAPEQVRGLAGRSSRRHVRVRRGALRDAHRRARVQGGDRRRHDDARSSPRSRRTSTPRGWPSLPASIASSGAVSRSRRSFAFSRPTISRSRSRRFPPGPRLRRRRSRCRAEARSKGERTAGLPWAIAAVAVLAAAAVVAAERARRRPDAAMGPIHADQRGGRRRNVADAYRRTAARWRTRCA